VPRASSVRRSRPRQPRSGEGVREVDGQRQDVGAPVLAQAPVEHLDDPLVPVHGDDLIGVAGGDVREAAVVAAQVPDALPTAGRGGGGDELGLLAGLVVGVGVVLAVADPDRLGVGLPRQPRHELVQLADVGLDELLAEAHLLELALDVPGAVGVLGLQARVEDDVREDARGAGGRGRGGGCAARWG
jgi:hypothetical protein